MFQNILAIPDADPISLPAPVWLLKFLLLFTFVLHIIPMNLALGGGFIAGLCHTIGKRKQSQNHTAVASALGRIIPYTVAATITFGIAPLLFLQVLYGQFFYTSSVLMAWPWLSVIALLIFGYYGFYRYHFQIQQGKSISAWIPWTSAFLFLIIGFLYTNNMVLMLTPENWKPLYLASAFGTHLNLGEPTLLPRFFHFLVAALAVSGLSVSLYGLWKIKRDDRVGLWAVRFGGKWFVWATLIQFAAGLWFLFSLPQQVRSMFLGEDAKSTLLLVAGVIFALLAITAALLAGKSVNPARLSITAAVSILLGILAMVLVRDAVRTKYIEPYFNVNNLSVGSQWSVFGLFAICLVAAVVMLVFMVRKVVGAGTTPGTSGA
jgi:hypothetical protein